jgi:hypothetical protein
MRRVDLGAFTSEVLGSGSYQFAPKADLDGKMNYCRHLFIDENGNTEEFIRLNVFDDRHREEIIGFHFAQQYASIRYRDSSEKPNFFVMGRDCPWDFEYVMHDGTHFFLEICRVGDKNLLKAIKAENDVMALLCKNELKGYEILKIERHFPGTMSEEVVGGIKSKIDKQRTFSVTPNIETRAFLRPSMVPTTDAKEAIKSAISSKNAKKHEERNKTILVLDNIMTHVKPSDFFEAIESLREYIDSVSFQSIWLYTGYYSDDHGYNCEYSLLPIKLSMSEMEILKIG